MRRFFILVTLLLAHCTALIADDLPPQAVEVTKGLDQDSDLIRSKLDVEFTGKRDLAIQKLQVIQDKYTRDAKLDPAVAVRDLIRSLKANNSYVQSEDLPTEAVEITKKLQQESDQLQAKLETEITAKREVAIRKLQAIQDSFTRQAKLDEAVAIRDLIRNLKGAALRPLPDPGSLTNYRGQHGKVLTFEVTGAMNGSVYGTDIYTDDSNLATAAVHANVLKPGEKGIVKVTILPGQNAYLSSRRSGITSNQYAQYPGSYKVQSLFRGNRPPVQDGPQEPGPVGPGTGADSRLGIDLPVLQALPLEPLPRGIPE